MKLFSFTIVISEHKSIKFSTENSVMNWVSDFTLLKLVMVDKKDKKIEVLALEREVLLDKKTLFVCYWFDVDGVKANEVKL